MVSKKLQNTGKALVVYLGSAWVLLEAMSFLIEKYSLPVGFQDLLILLIILGLPATVILNWYDSLKNLYPRILLIINFLLAVWFIGDGIRNFDTETVTQNEFLSSGNAPNSIVVLPFRNMTGIDSLDFLVSGIRESISNKLGELNLFTVKDPRAANKYRTLSASISQIQDELDVDAYVEASVFGNMDSIQLEIRITSTNSEHVIWSASYNKGTKDIYHLFKTVSSDIAEQLEDSYKPDKNQATFREIDQNAYLVYQKGRFYLDELTEEGLNLAIKYFRKAIEIDSTFAEAYASISWACGAKFQMNFIEYNEAMPIILKNFRKAMSLDSNSAEIQHIRGAISFWWNWDLEEGYKGFQKALSINPSYSAAHAGFSHVNVILRKFEEAQKHGKKAIELDPYNNRYITFYAQVLNFSRQYGKTIEMLKDTTGNVIQHPMTYNILRTTYHLMGEKDKAIDMWLKYFDYNSDITAYQVIKEKFEQGGYETALNALADLYIKRKSGSNGIVPAWNISTVFLRAGELEKSLDWLELAYEEHSPNLPYIKTDPIFDPLRGKPRFLAISDKLN